VTSVGISRTTVLIFAVAAGIAQANVNALQPILAVIGADLHAGPQTIGLVSMAMQIGFALGIVAFVPLGDIVQRRWLIVGLFGATAVSLGTAAVVPNVTLLALVIGVDGVTTMAPQLLQPFAVDLALPSEGGRVLGIIQTGMVVGALLGRVTGGLIAAHAGWRAVFVCSAIITALTTVVLIPAIPLRPARAQLRYRDLFASMPGFLRAYPALRGTIAMGFLMYAVMMGLWTVFAFHVRDLGYGSDVVGYIGLVSIVGALIAARVGRLADIYGTLTTGTFGWLVTVLAFLVFLFAGNTVAGVTVGMGMFLIGAQTAQLSNLARIFAMSDEGRSRLNTLYMLMQFAGGAYGSVVCGWVFPGNGWPGVCLVCLAHLGAIGLLLAWLRRNERSAAEPLEVVHHAS
jgi:predicted MFS family arabinose efflux permease